MTNFGSTLQNHPDDHGKLFAMTSYQAAFSRNEQKDILGQTMTERNLRDIPAGTVQRNLLAPQGTFVTNEGVKKTSVLTGEQYRDFEDPQQNTHCQRTWVYGGDNTLAYVDGKLRTALIQNGGEATPELVMATHFKNVEKQNTTKADGLTSLPLEGGDRAFFPPLTHNGAYRKKRSDVTRVANQPLTFK